MCATFRTSCWLDSRSFSNPHRCYVTELVADFFLEFETLKQFAQKIEKKKERRNILFPH